MSRRSQLVLLIAVYSLFFLGTLYWSGVVTKRTTLYDRFLITLEGAHILAADVDDALSFYTQVLDFTPMFSSSGKSEAKQLIGFLLPEKKKLFLGPVLAASSDVRLGTVVDLKVRNGLEKLHQRILARSKKSSVPISTNYNRTVLESFPKKRVSSLVRHAWGNEFLVKDGDGNIIVFFQPKRFLGSRY